MNKMDIIDTLTEQGIDIYDAIIATSCHSAWEGVRDTKTFVKLGIDFDKFCEICNNLWLEAGDDHGLTSLADQVAGFILDNKKIPTEWEELMLYSVDY